MDTGTKLTDKGREARAEYLRMWRKRNADKCKRYAEQYWNRCAAKSQDKKNQSRNEGNKR